MHMTITVTWLECDTCNKLKTHGAAAPTLTTCSVQLVLHDALPSGTQGTTCQLVSTGTHHT